MGKDPGDAVAALDVDDNLGPAIKAIRNIAAVEGLVCCNGYQVSIKQIGELAEETVEQLVADVDNSDLMLCRKQKFIGALLTLRLCLHLV